MSDERTPIAGPPGESLHPSSRRRILVCAAAALLVTLVVNAVAAYYLARHPLNQAARVIRAKWSLLLRQTEPVDLLVLGDSSGNHGVDPAVLEARLGGTALNLCTVGDLLAVNDAWMLERYLRDVGTPRAVLVVHTFDVWSRDRNPDAIAQVPLPFGFWKAARPPAPLSIAESARVLLDRYVPLYSQDQTISRLLRSPRRTLTRTFDMDASGFYHSRRALPQEVMKDFHAKVRELEKEDADEDEKKEKRKPISLENRTALEVLAELAHEHGLDIYIAHAPLYEGLWEIPDFRRRHARLERALLDIASSRRRLRVLQGPPVTFPADRMTNVDHLVDESARAFTEVLAGRIASLGTGGISPPVPSAPGGTPPSPRR